MKVRILSYLLLFVFLVACSGKNDKDLFESGKNKIENKDYVGAVTDFERVVNEFPNSEFEVQALYELAKLYHGNVIKEIPKEASLSKAVHYYKLVQQKKPKSVEGEKSLFMAGFLEANELHRIKDAEKTYKKFLKTYPKSPLAASAEVEIQNLGIPPEEILKKKANVDVVK